MEGCRGNRRRDHGREVGFSVNITAIVVGRGRGRGDGVAVSLSVRVAAAIVVAVIFPGTQGEVDESDIVLLEKVGHCP